MSKLFKKLKSCLEKTIAYERDEIDLFSEDIVLFNSFQVRGYSIKKRKRK